MLKKLFLYYLIIFGLISNAYSEDIPVIVIAPSKKPQSISTVGSSVTVYTEEDIQNSSESFLHNILNYGSPGLSSYQSGGAGTTSNIQLRGLPGRYATIYIDGVKMSDPSNVSNDYYFDDLLKSSISRIEILRGNQSSIYGSGAMGGTINITTKKGKKGFQKNFNALTGSNETINLSGSISGADETKDFWLGYERFHTSGESAMTDNDESDAYTNNSLVGNFGYKLNDEIKLQASSRVIHSFLNFDAVDSSTNPNNDDNNQNWNTELFNSIGLVHEPLDNFSQTLKLAKSNHHRTYDQRKAFSSSKAESEYYGFRDAINYSGTYNHNLDHSITFGFEYENDEMKYEKTLYRGDDVYSYYFDVQNRLTENLYTTFGMRFDEHSAAGNEDSHRVSFAYLTDDKKTKIKGSYGTSYRFPSLYENYKSWSEAHIKGKMTAETGKSHDIGIERSFLNNKFNLDLTYFNNKYYDTLDGWKDTVGDFNTYYHNQNGLVKSEGLELGSKWKFSDKLNFDLNYTLQRTYDGADMDDALNNDGNSGGTGGGAFVDSRMARVPRHALGLNTYYRIPQKNLSINLQTIYAGNSRDYGNFNSPKHGTSYLDAQLDAYFVNHLDFMYNYIPGYDVFFKIVNLTDESYQTALDYSQPSRSFNFGIRRSFDKY
jgi:vitamin B12 transporter